jgi:hypothetical protein
MWAFGVGSPKGERLTYRGYELEICKHPIGWRLGISPIRPELPILANRSFTVPYPRKDDALSAARKRIDLVLLGPAGEQKARERGLTFDWF